jgi:hypothetical protein
MSGKVFHAPFKFSPGFELWVVNAVKANQIDFPEMKSYASIDELLADDMI